MMESHTVSKLNASRQKEDALKSGDVFYPVETVTKVARRALSTYSTLSPESASEIQRCVKEFATLVASEAGVQSSLEHPTRNMLRGEDVLAALTSLGYEEYADILEIYLHKLRQGSKDPESYEQSNALGSGNTKKDKSSKSKVKEEKSSAASSSMAPPAKKSKSTS